MSRLRGIAIFFTLLLLGFSYRLYDWQVKRFDQFQSRSENNYLRSEPIRAWRGEIRTRDGVLLATNRVSVDLIYKWVSSKDNRPLVAWEKIRYLAGIKDSKMPELPVGSEVVLASNIPQQNLSALYEYVVFQPNLELRERIERVYPEGKLASNLLGYVGETNEEDLATGKYQLGDIIGKTGLEVSLEDHLRGVNGLKITEVDFKGRRINERVEREGEAGKNIVLTINSKVQRAAEKALEEGLADVKRQLMARKDIKDARGAIVALDPRNGQVLALASRPTFNPNWFSTYPAPKQKQQALLDEAGPMINRAVNAYTPGSVFKPTTTNAIIEHFGRNPVFGCPSGIMYGGRFWRNWDWRNRGAIDGRGAIAHSCNPWYYQASIQGDPVPFSNVLARRALELGFGEPTGIELVGEKLGRIPSQKAYKEMGVDWWPGSTLNISIGQGDVLVTPLQLARVLATLINEGRKQPVTVIKNINGKEQGAKSTTQVAGRAYAWDQVKEGMQMTTTEGTSKHMLGPDRFPIRTGGKTGTAQTSLRIKGKTEYFEHSWYEGYGPLNNPNLVVVAFFEFGGEGSGVALPAVKKVMAAHWGLKLDEQLRVVTEEDTPTE